MAIIKMEDIDRIYTEILTDYFTKGYRLYTKNMSGHQGERAKIDITNGKHILRIWMETFSCKDIGDKENWLWTDGIEINIEEFEDFRASTLWGGKGKMLKTLTFYRVGSKNHAYTMDVEECEKLLLVNANRRRLRSNTFSNWEKVNYNPDTIIKIVNSKRGFKTCKKKDIKSVERCKTMYRIIIEGKNDSVCVRFPNK